MRRFPALFGRRSLKWPDRKRGVAPPMCALLAPPPLLAAAPPCLHQRRQSGFVCLRQTSFTKAGMSEPDPLETRIAALEATVRALQAELAEFRKSLPPPAQPPTIALRSRGMLDRPATRK